MAPWLMTEQHLVTVHGILQTVEALHLILAALQPARRPCHGILHIFPLGKRRRTFIERMAIVEPRLDWICMLSSGPMKIFAPSICEWK